MLLPGRQAQRNFNSKFFSFIENCPKVPIPIFRALIFFSFNQFPYFIINYGKIKNSIFTVIQVLQHLFIYLFIVFCPFRAAPTAYGGSQARGLIGAVAATTTATPDPSCILHQSSQQQQILNPLSKARNWTLIFMVTMSGS